MPQSLPLVVTLVSDEGVRPMADRSDLRKLLAADTIFWIDIIGGDEHARGALLDELGLRPSDLTWSKRTQRSGRMAISRDRLRAVTWVAQHSDALAEIDLLATSKYILTVWNGEPSLLDEDRQQFAERAGQLAKGPFEAAAILLQLLLGTFHRALGELDDRLLNLVLQLDQKLSSDNLKTLANHLRDLMAFRSDFERYSSSVRSAVVGIQALPGIDQRGAIELNKYASQVDDLEGRLQERGRWGSDILQYYEAAIARHQGEQINRLTIISIIFLPLTFMTGFFGMNFSWMNAFLRTPTAFVVLGILLPAISALLTIVWLRRRGLL
jgi:Mg2+ and Co2+ transporter CorA